MSDRPEIRLLPRIKPARLRHGFPWVYANELVMDRRTRKIEPGTIVTLADADRAPLATAAFNPASKIAARILDLDPGAEIDEGWFEQRLKGALALRLRLFDAPFYRLVHAEGDRMPGVIIDRFGDALAIQPNAAWADARLAELASAAARVTGAEVVYKNASGRARALEGLDDRSELLAGKLEGPVPVPMNGATYLADIAGGQKTGLFYDQRPNHAFAAQLARGARVLDVFSHVGGFSLACLAGGAASALAIDSSTPALELAREGARLSGVEARFETRRADAFEAMADLAEEGATFELVVCDPPAFAPSRAALERFRF